MYDNKTPILVLLRLTTNDAAQSNTATAAMINVMLIFLYICCTANVISFFMPSKKNGHFFQVSAH